MKTFTAIGAFFVIFSLLGNLVPGLAFRLYFGTEDGAREWHIRSALGSKMKTTPQPPPAPKHDHMTRI